MSTDLTRAVEIIEGLGCKQSNLIAIMQDIQAEYNYLSQDVLELIAEKIAIIKLNRLNTEGLSSQSFSGVSESYIDGYPAEIKAVLNRKRKVKII